MSVRNPTKEEIAAARALVTPEVRAAERVLRNARYARYRRRRRVAVDLRDLARVKTVNALGKRLKALGKRVAKLERRRSR